MMSFKIIFLLAICVAYATARTAKQYRQFPSYNRHGNVDYPSYNIIAPDGPGTYAFGFEIEDIRTGNVQFKDEEKLRNGTIRGSYGLLQPDGTIFITKYIADNFGIRSKQEVRRPGAQPQITEQNVPFHKPSGLTAEQYPANVQVIPESHYGAVPASQIPGIAGDPHAHAHGPIPLPTAVPIPPPYSTRSSVIDPNVANSMLRQYQVDLNPTYNPLYDDNYFNPQMANAVLSPNFPLYRQNGVSNFQNQNNRPFTFPFLNWLNPNNNNNNFNQDYNGNYQSDTPAQQPGPVVSFIQQIPSAIQNFAQNNPVSQFWNGIWNNNNNQNQNNPGFFQQWNPFQNQNNMNSYTNIPQVSGGSQAPQSDYIPSPVHSNFDNSVFSTDRYPTGQYRPPNTPMYGNNYLQYLTNQNPNGQPYQFQNPYMLQAMNQRPGINGYSVLGTNYNGYNTNKRTRNKNRKSNKNKNKNRDDDDDDYGSEWFSDFLERRKRLNLEANGIIETTTVKAVEEAI